jgi:hypothetical protein
VVGIEFHTEQAFHDPLKTELVAEFTRSFAPPLVAWDTMVYWIEKPEPISLQFDREALLSPNLIVMGQIPDVKSGIEVQEPDRSLWRADEGLWHNAETYLRCAARMPFVKSFNGCPV